MADEQSLPLYRGASAVFRGWFAAKNGDIVSGIELVRRGTTAYRATGADLWGPFFDALLAEACEIAGRYEEAAQLLHDAELTVEGRGARWFVAELNRRQGRLLYRQGCLEAAEQLHRKAMSIATHVTISRISARRPLSPHNRARLVAARNSHNLASCCDLPKALIQPI